ncbi:MAG: GxxExxY protein [Prevotella sp.]|nr:GxxExxY protein [Prevotella sp.]
MELLYKELTYQINGAAMEVHRTLGCGFLEKVYQEAFAIALAEKGIKFQREKSIPVFFHGHQLGTPYICDFLVDDKIIVELKAVQALEPIHQAQLLNYLKASGMKIGLLYNFNDTSLHPVRLLNSMAIE